MSRLYHEKVECGTFQKSFTINSCKFYSQIELVTPYGTSDTIFKKWKYTDFCNIATCHVIRITGITHDQLIVNDVMHT